MASDACWICSALASAVVAAIAELGAGEVVDRSLVGLAVVGYALAVKTAMPTSSGDRIFVDNNFILLMLCLTLCSGAIEYSKLHIRLQIFSFLHDILPFAIEIAFRFTEDWLITFDRTNFNS